MLKVIGLAMVTLQSSLSWGADPIIPDFDITSLLPLTAVQEVVKIGGNLSDHRPYQGATPLQAGRFAAGIEASVIHLPDDISTALAQAGIHVDTTEIPALPVPKLHLRLGLFPDADIGFSGLFYRGSSILGVGLKFLIFEPEEGLSWAIRTNYSRTQIDLAQVLTSKTSSLPIEVAGIQIGSGSISFESQTGSVEIVASHRLIFAEPYAGAGIHWINGSVSSVVNIDLLNLSKEIRSPNYSFYHLNFFTGLSFHLRPFLFSIEGGYSSIGMHHLGAIAGFEL